LKFIDHLKAFFTPQPEEPDPSRPYQDLSPEELAEQIDYHARMWLELVEEENLRAALRGPG
tara:strand:- start:11986 stop:12168 length:183 start_codon:yes stop_codon:yes gene_type:complete